MRRKSCLKLWTCTSGIFLAGMAIPFSAEAQSVPAVTGNLATTGVNYGQGSAAPYANPLTVQTINTSFGDSTYSYSPGPDANGSELDAAYGTSADGYLFLFFSGDFGQGNLLNVFIQAGSNGSNTLTAPNGAGSMQAMNGSIFSPGFNPTYAFEINDANETGTSTTGTSHIYLDQFPLTGANANYVGSVALSKGIGASQNVNNSGVELAINNSNISTMGATAGLAYSSTSALSVATGIEIGIPLSTLGNPVAGSVEVMADINGGGDGGVSNQALPGLNLNNVDIKLPSGTVVNGVTNTNPNYLSTNTAGFTFANTPNEYFTVSVPVTPGIWIPLSGGTWGSASNWTNSYIPGLPGDTASFSSATTSSTVTLDGSRTVGDVNFNSLSSYTISPGSGGSLILQAPGGTASITDIQGNDTISAPVVLNSNTTLTEESNGNVFTISGNISGTGSLTTAGEALNTRTNTVSEIILSGSNSFTGGLTILRGNLQLGAANALPAGTNLTLNGFDSPQGTLDLNGFSATVSSLIATDTVVDGGSGNTQIEDTSTTSGTATFTYAGSYANPSTYIGNISDTSASGGNALSLMIATGSLTLTGNNTYGGGTTVAAGASLQIDSADANGIALPGSGLLTNNGSLIINDNLVGGISIAGSGVTTFNAGFTELLFNLTQSGGLVNNAATEILISAVTGPISGAGTLTIDSSLQLTGGPSTIATLNLSSGATMDLNGTSVTIGAIPDDGSGAIIGNSSLSSSASLIYSGVSDTLSATIQDGINGSGGKTSLSIAAGSLNLNGNNTYSGGTSVSGGALLTISATGALPSGGSVANNGTLDIEASSVVGNVSGTGALLIGASSASALQLKASSGASSVGSLTINPGSSLDLTNNALTIKYGSAASPLSTIQSYLTDGYDAGWTGGEIQSSSVAALNASQSALIYSVGYADGADGITGVPSGEIEILPTLAGDAKMQGNVVFGDFQLLSQYFGQANTTWDEGDFTYNGTTNFGDFQLLSQNFGQSAGGLTSGEIASINSFAAEFGEAYVPSGTGYSLASVPEPASAAILAIGGLGLLSRRRKKLRD
jgi:fibronectin-binding autotransporter adhesin